jgi:hypothetical protein
MQRRYIKLLSYAWARLRRLKVWNGERLLPFFGVEWICVRPRYIKRRGKLIDDEIFDVTLEFIAILNNFSIPYIEKDGAYYIYGYTK